MIRSCLHLSLLLLACAWTVSASAQTVALSTPVADPQGNVAFQVTQVLRVEGIWDHPIEVGQLIKPAKPTKAHPLMRFGESVILVFRTPDALTQWEGLNVHNGCIPALKGEPAEDLVRQVESAPAWKAPEVVDKHDRLMDYGICPVCGQRHLRIPTP